MNDHRETPATGTDTSGRLLRPALGVVLLAPLAWSSAILTMSAAPWFGTTQPDPGAGAGPDVWDLNRGLTRGFAIPLLVLNAISFPMLAGRFTARSRAIKAHPSAWIVVLVGLVSLPAWGVLVVFSIG